VSLELSLGTDSGDYVGIWNSVIPVPGDIKYSGNLI